MYVSITTKCNMSCAHCCFSCAQGKEGEFMSRATFRRILASTPDSYIAIGGGEPTLHPKFWEFMADALACGNLEDECGIWLATNGSVTRTALALGKMAKSGVIGCALSQDEYHDPIDPQVIAYFHRNKLEIRNTSDQIMDHGSAKANGIGMVDRCACEGLHVKPTGDVYLCGCADSLKLGGVEVLEDNDLMERVSQYYRDYGECGSKVSDEQIGFILGMDMRRAA